eukprot:UN18009
MEIAILASRGVKPAEIVKAVGCTFDMAIRWSDRSEEVMQTDSVQSKRKGKVEPKPIFAAPSAKKTLRVAQRISTEKVGEEIDSYSESISSTSDSSFVNETIRSAICRSG